MFPIFQIPSVPSPLKFQVAFVNVVNRFISAVVFPVPAGDVVNPEDVLSQKQFVTVPVKFIPMKPPLYELAVTVPVL